MNRADALEDEGRKGTVGFALTILQRRLASSPEAIYQSLRRRRERLEKRLREEELLNRGAAGPARPDARTCPTLTDDDIDDLDDAPDGELEETEEQVVDQATAARTIAELEAEIAILKGLEDAGAPRSATAGTDTQVGRAVGRSSRTTREMFDAHGHRRKLIIFTEHRDTLNYLVDRIGGAARPARGRRHDPRRHAAARSAARPRSASRRTRTVEILVATDAAGEGINLQRAHLMVNYDLPWNPNRIEQRFGRIHRIGQTEVCHLWNLVADETREGEVYKRLLEKLEEERQGARRAGLRRPRQALPRPAAPRPAHRGDPLRRPARGPRHASRRSSTTSSTASAAASCSTSAPSPATPWTRPPSGSIREEMERAEARRLQPHFIASFFLEAFKLLGGTLPRARAEALRDHPRPGGHPQPRPPDRPRQPRPRPLRAHHLREEPDRRPRPAPGRASSAPAIRCSTRRIDLILERYRDLFKRGAVLVDPADPGDDVRVLFYLEHVDPGRPPRHERPAPRRLAPGPLRRDRTARATSAPAGYAPYLDYRPLDRRGAAAHRADPRRPVADARTSKRAPSSTPSPSSSRATWTRSASAARSWSRRRRPR